MKPPFRIVTAAIVVLAALFFYFAFRELSTIWFDLAQRPEVRRALQRSMDDQKRLTRLDPSNEAQYRRRFEEAAQLMHHIDVIRINREQLLHRLSLLFTGIFALIVGATALIWTVRDRRNQERRRQEYLQRLASWQEASRRHAHEIRTPLTAARLELERLITSANAGASGEEIVRIAGNASAEFDRLARFTRNFVSVAAITRPVLREERLDLIVFAFCELFKDAWPNLQLRVDGQTRETVVHADRDLLRQVFVNLCSNSARAIESTGIVRISMGRHSGAAFVDVADDGPGIPSSIRQRVFEPYVTTSRTGDGMGLGLAISRKIMLDHGGDLELVHDAGGATFRLRFPRQPPAEIGEVPA